MSVRLEGNEVLSYKPLITGFQQDESAWGRPVDVQPMPDGSVLISDDLAGGGLSGDVRAVTPPVTPV